MAKSMRDRTTAQILDAMECAMPPADLEAVFDADASPRGKHALLAYAGAFGDIPRTREAAASAVIVALLTGKRTPDAGSNWNDLVRAPMSARLLYVASLARSGARL